MFRRLQNTSQQREVHLGILGFLVFVTNCRYIAMHQPTVICAELPLVFQCFGLAMFAVEAGCTRAHPETVKSLRTWVVLGLGIGAATCAVLSLVHVHHLLQCTVSILNAYVLVVMALELVELQEETVAGSGTPTSDTL